MARTVHEPVSTGYGSPASGVTSIMYPIPVGRWHLSMVASSVDSTTSSTGLVRIGLTRGTLTTYLMDQEPVFYGRTQVSLLPAIEVEYGDAVTFDFIQQASATVICAASIHMIEVV